MKRLIFLFSLMVVFVGLSAQVTLKTKATKILTPSAWSFNLTGSLADSLGVYQDSLIQPIQYSANDSMATYIRTKITEVTSACNVTVQFQAKRYSTDSWTTLQSKTYTGVGTDTTLKFYTGTLYRTMPYMQLVYIRNANKAYVSSTSAWIFK